jgi:uncharacterized protein DUF2330
MGSSRGGSAAVRSGGVWRGRALRLLLVLASIQLTMVAQPAWACGCGAAIPAAGQTLTVGQETSVVRWDGGVEEIDMRLTVSGDAKQAAWIMPVPSRATLTLGDTALFSTLEEVVAPVDRVRHYFWPRAGDWPFAGNSPDRASSKGSAPAPGAGVDVVGRERLGPFDVARLAATDSKALGEWLTANGFHLPDALATALEPYVRQNWEYVAIRLAPDVAGKPLSGTLDPLHLSFASDHLVYPMRLSRLAKVPQHLRLYVVAAHRMQPRSDIGGAAPRVLYAGVPREPASAAPQLRAIAGKPAFLTAIDQNFPTPATITDDHDLLPAAHDDTYQQVRYTDELQTIGGVPAWVVTVVGALIAVLVGVAAIVARRRRSARRGPSLPRTVAG